MPARRPTLIIILLIGLILPPLAAQAQAQPEAMRNMVIYVRDQYGQLTANAELTIRDRASYRVTNQLVTNQGGYAQVVLDTSNWYVVQVHYREFGSKEYWAYGYIKADDWGSIYPYGIKTFQRNDLWIDQVTLPQGEVRAGYPATLTVSVDHALTQTNFGLFARLRLIIDDDGQPPYLYEQLAAEQLIAEGLQPFTFAPSLASAGQYQLRLILERRFENNPWEVADDGGWSWPMTVTGPQIALSGLLYLDMNSDGQPSAGEPPAAGATVQLYDAQDQPLASATCDALGQFQFAGLTPAEYRLRVAALPQGLGRPRPVYAVTLSAESSEQPVALALDPWRAMLPWVRGA